ncbi:MAG: hypothetical protein Tsb0020_11780 [Haliangiales bacterium]
MRVAAQVLLAYALMLVCGAIWHRIADALEPVLRLHHAIPDLVALSSVYLGLTARQQLAPATCGAVIIGYLGDLLLGTPRGTQALVAGVVCLLGHVIHRRLIVRGLLRTAILGAFAGLAAGLLGMLTRAYAGHLPTALAEPLVAAGTAPAPGSLMEQLGVLVWAALLTGLAGPVVFRLCRRLDARFARTQREREAAREGITL